jgi:hypothetical protein
MRMAWLAVAVVACSGEEATEECTDQSFLVDVIGPSNEDVVDATVEVDNLPCTANGDGTYNCSVPAQEEHQVFVLHMNYTAFSQFLQGSETCDLITVDVTLQPPMGM